MNDVQMLLHTVAELQKKVAGMVRHGTVTDTKPGFVRINWGDTERSDDASGTPMQSPWIRTSSHNGVVSENIPFKKGQTVTSISMDQDHLTGLVLPHSPSDNNPLDGNASNDKHTYRIRKPQEASNSSGGGQQAGSGGGASQNSAAKDDDDDFQYNRTYNGHEVKVGKNISITTDREAKTVTVINKNTKTVHGEDTITHTVGENGSSIEQAADHITKTVGNVVHRQDGSGHTFTGGGLTHNGLPIDATHVHKGVQPGAGLTGIPNK